MKEVNINLSTYKLVIVNPRVHINTGWAFAQLDVYSEPNSIENVINKPLKEWKDQLINDFEAPVLQHYPALRTIKDGLYQMGALYASMSGSGSTFTEFLKTQACPISPFFLQTTSLKQLLFFSCIRAFGTVASSLASHACAPETFITIAHEVALSELSFEICKAIRLKYAPSYFKYCYHYTSVLMLYFL